MSSYRPMNKTLMLLGASILTHGIMLSGAEARLVRYEINGKQYSYSTNNLAQTAEAKKRIAEAEAAEAAKAKNPIAATAFGFGKKKETDEVETQPKPASKGKAAASERDQTTEERADKGDTRPNKPDRRIATAKPLRVTAAPIREVVKPAEAPPPIAIPVAEPLDPQRQTKVKSVSFDVEAGIKTTIMIDGAIEEEPFDSSVLAYLVRETGKTSSLMAFVKQLRKAAPEDITGSIKTTTARPEDDELLRDE